MLCPKCHRPLADEDEGRQICCADASLQWRCCAVRRGQRGLCLPYGRCPHCGGKLALRDGRAARPTLRALDAHPHRVRDRARRARLLPARRGRQRRSGAAPLFGRFAADGGRAHGDALAPLPRRRAGAVAGVPGRARGDLRRRREPPAGSGEPVSHRDRAGEAGRRLLRRALRPGAAGVGRAAALHANWPPRNASTPRPGHRVRTLARGPGRVCSRASRSAPRAQPARTRWQARSTPPRCCSRGSRRGAHRAVLRRREPELRRAARQRGARRVGLAIARRRAGRPRRDQAARRLSTGSVAFLGAIWAGGVAVAVNPRIPDAEWHYILDEAGFSAIVAESCRRHAVAVARARGALTEAWRRAMAQAAPGEPERDGPRGTPAFWCHSSGTSGKPKAVVHAQRFVRQIERVSRERPGHARPTTACSRARSCSSPIRRRTACSPG